MRFEIDRPIHNEPDEILSAYPILKKYEPKIDFPYENKTVPRLTIEVSSISELLELQQGIKEEIILGQFEGEYFLEIYDNYRE